MKSLISRIIRKIRPVINSSSELNYNNYENRIINELDFYKDCHNVHDLPEIFHYWSNKYLLPKELPFGFASPDDFFVTYCKEYCLKHPDIKSIEILSVGSGNGELEVNIASQLFKQGFTNFSVTCMDINANMLDRTIELARKNNVEDFIKINKADFNKWQPTSKYEIVIANQSLHHVLELEHLFNSIEKGLTETGLFLTSDMIGRNGHMRWPEALEALEPFWDELPAKFKFNQLLKRQEDTYINHDCSTEGFEGIRAQDILKLLVERFNFELFVPFANIIMVFIDRPFGHNFDVNNPEVLEFIDRVHLKDEELMLNGTLKPTQMLAAMTKSVVSQTKLTNPILTPEFCIREAN